MSADIKGSNILTDNDVLEKEIEVEDYYKKNAGVLLEENEEKMELSKDVDEPSGAKTQLLGNSDNYNGTPLHDTYPSNTDEATPIEDEASPEDLLATTDVVESEDNNYNNYNNYSNDKNYAKVSSGNKLVCWILLALLVLALLALFVCDLK